MRRSLWPLAAALCAASVQLAGGGPRHLSQVVQDNSANPRAARENAQPVAPAYSAAEVRAARRLRPGRLVESGVSSRGFRIVKAGGRGPGANVVSV